MSNKTQLETNNTTLDEYIARINAAKEVAASLPEAGSGGSSGEIETCTVNITHYPSYSTSCAVRQIVYQTLDDEGNIIIQELSDTAGTIDFNTNNFSISKVVCPSIFCAVAQFTNLVITGGIELYRSGSYTIQINENATLQFQPTI